MKRLLLAFAILFIGLTSQAEEVFVSSVNLDNLWNKLGLREEKLNIVGAKLLNANQINKRIVFNVNSFNSVNASASYSNKTVSVNKGTFNYIDNDDELAAMKAASKFI